MEWINNPWAVGIGGGTLSGLLVTAISRAIFSRRDRREYTQKLLSANREVIYAIRPGISEGHLPDHRIVGSLINATARKYAVDAGDMYDPIKVSEELTKEIMDSSFISAATKQEYCGQLETLKPKQPQPQAVVRVEQRTRPSDLSAYRSRMVTIMSRMLGVMTALMTVVIVFIDKLPGSTLGSRSDLLAFLLPGLVAIGTTVMVAAFTMLRNDYRRRINRGDEKSTTSHRRQEPGAAGGSNDENAT